MFMGLVLACGHKATAGNSSDEVPLQTVIKVCIPPQPDFVTQTRIRRAIQETVVAWREGTEYTIIPEIESSGGTTFYISYGVPQSRIDEIADAMAKSTPEVERVVQVKIRPFEDSGPPDDVCEDRPPK